MADEAQLPYTWFEIPRVRGDNKRIVFQLKKKSDGLPLDITGYSFVLTANTEKDPTDDTNKLFSINGTIVDAANGKVAFVPTEANMDSTTNFYFDVQVTDTNTEKETPIKGVFKFKQDITKT